TYENTTLTVAAPGVLANDTDPSGGTLTVVSNTQPANGSVTMNSDGSFTYTPNQDFAGTDTFTYTISNGQSSSGGSGQNCSNDRTTATVTINVQPPPVAVNDAYGIGVPGPSPLEADAATGVLANDSVAPGSTLTATLVTGPSHGTLTFNS